MGQVIETRINNFSGGISNDPRDSRPNVSRVLTNFDVSTYLHKLVPYRQSESGDSAASTSRKQNFAIAKKGAANIYSLYGLGVVSGTNRPEVEIMDLDASLNSDTWGQPTANQGGANYNITNVRFRTWVYYQNLGFIFGIANDTGNGDLRIFAFSPSGGAWNNDVTGALSATDDDSLCAQGLVHSKNDHLFIPYDNKIARKSQGSLATDEWTVSAFTVPAHFIITSLCEWGNLLALGCAARNGVGNSKVFFWNMDPANTLPTESIDWGTGSLMILEDVDGELIGISQKGGASSSFATIPNLDSAHKDRVIFRRLVGNRAVKFHQLSADRAGGINTTSLPIYKQKVDNRLYFQMIIQYNGAVRDGVWSVGKNELGEFTLVHERTSNNNTVLTTGDAVRGFIQIGDFLFQSFGSGGAGATYNTNKTVESSTTSYTATSIVETKIFDGSLHGYDSSWYKDLVEVSVGTEEMVTLGQIVLQYAIDEDIEAGTWTTIFTNTTNESISHTAMNIESGGAALPKNYKQIQFRLESTGGAEPTFVSFKEDVIGKKYVQD